MDKSTYAAGASSMITIVLAWAWNTFLGAKYGTMPAEVAGALGGLVAAGVSEIVPDDPAAPKTVTYTYPAGGGGSGLAGGSNQATGGPVSPGGGAG